MKKIAILLLSLLSIPATGFTQSFDWHQDGYINGSGGERYLNIDGSGIDLQISGLINDGGFRGGVRSGIDNNAAGREIHEYTFIFSERVDLKFTISDINGGTENCGFIDYVGFSGNPVFSSPRDVKIIDDSLVVPVANGLVTVEYYSIDTLIIRHGQGIKCNPGFIVFSSLVINQNVQRLTGVNPSAADSLTLENLLFDTGISDLDSAHFEQLDQVISLLIKNPAYRVRICGHTDHVGNISDNLRLSEDRVQSVHEYLLRKGIGRTRFEVVFYGESAPDASNNSTEGRQQNRRVEIQLIVP